MFNLEKFKELKQEQGRETWWLAKQTGVKEGTIRAYLSGDKSPSLPVVKNMARAFGVPETVLWADDASLQRKAG